MGKGLTTGKAFYTGLRSKITDPEQLKAFDALVGNEAFLTELGNGVEGQSEIDRQLQELATQRQELDQLQTKLDERKAGLESWHGELTDWYTKNKSKLEAGGTPAGKEPTKVTKPTTEPPTTGLTEEQLNERIVAERAGFLGFSRDQNLITREHFTKFNEIIDLEPLLKHPQVGTLGLKGVYELVHKDRLEQHAAAAAKKAEDAIRADERSKVLAANTQMPYITPTGVGSGSPLDALTPAAKDGVVDAATAHYNRLQAERNGAAGAGA